MDGEHIRFDEAIFMAIHKFNNTVYSTEAVEIMMNMHRLIVCYWRRGLIDQVELKRSHTCSLKMGKNVNALC